MYCSNCGAKVVGSGRFCSNCGSPVSASSSAPRQGDSRGAKRASGELNREALIIYLRNLEALEFAVRRHGRLRDSSLDAYHHASNMNHVGCIRVNRFTSRLELQGYVLVRWNGECPQSLFNAHGEVYLAEGNLDPNRVSVCVDLGQWGKEMYWRALDKQVMEDLRKNIILYKDGLFGLGKYTRRIWGKVDPVEGDNVLRRIEENFLPTARDKWIRKQAKVERKKQAAESIESELSQAKHLLRKSYNLNIIPNQYRNLYAVDFLYSFLKSSNLTLSEALLHFNLEEIKQKLDKVIEKQEQIILQNEIIIAQNEKLLKKNTAMLNGLASIERTAENIAGSSALAAQYSRIAATNSETCAWFCAVQTRW